MKNSERYDERLDAALVGSGFRQDDVLLPKLDYCAKIRGERWSARPIRFLDYGCGPGRLMRHFHVRLGRESQYTGFDLSADSIRRARQEYGDRGRFMESSDREQLRGESFELILAAGVFHHIPSAERPDVMVFLESLLAPDGVLVVWEHNPLNPFTQWVVSRCAFDDDASLIGHREMIEFFRRSGLTRIRCDFVTFFPGNFPLLVRLEKYLRRVPAGGQYVVAGDKLPLS